MDRQQLTLGVWCVSLAATALGVPWLLLQIRTLNNALPEAELMADGAAHGMFLAFGAGALIFIAALLALSLAMVMLFNATGWHHPRGPIASLVFGLPWVIFFGLVSSGFDVIMMTVFSFSSITLVIASLVHLVDLRNRPLPPPTAPNRFIPETTVLQPPPPTSPNVAGDSTFG